MTGRLLAFVLAISVLALGGMGLGLWPRSATRSNHGLMTSPPAVFAQDNGGGDNGGDNGNTEPDPEPEPPGDNAVGDNGSDNSAPPCSDPGPVTRVIVAITDYSLDGPNMAISFKTSTDTSGRVLRGTARMGFSVPTREMNDRVVAEAVALLGAECGTTVGKKVGISLVGGALDGRLPRNRSNAVAPEADEAVSRAGSSPDPQAASGR
jgi:hypothetical protein